MPTLGPHHSVPACFVLYCCSWGILMNWAIVSKRPDLAWLVSLVTIGASIAYCGSYCVGTLKGIFIDRRNVMSPHAFK